MNCIILNNILDIDLRFFILILKLGYIFFAKNNFLYFFKCRPKSIEILQTCCRIYPIYFLKTCQSILDFFRKCSNKSNDFWPYARFFFYLGSIWQKLFFYKTKIVKIGLRGCLPNIP